MPGRRPNAIGSALRDGHDLRDLGHLETDVEAQLDQLHGLRVLLGGNEPGHSGQVIVAIFTDGLENSSTTYDMQRISRMITHQQEKYSWQFLFLAANQDAIGSAAKMGIPMHHASDIAASKFGIRSSSAAFSRKLAAMRHFASTGQKSADVAAPMEDIVAEEQDKASREEPKD